MTGARVAGFTPSAAGFHFANSFPHVPVRQIAIPGLGAIPIGDAANGLCGGMSYTVGDLWTAHIPPPADTGAPGAGTAAFSYLVDRQFDSFDGGRVPFRFYELMSPARPAREPVWAGLLGQLSVDDHSRTYVMVQEEWPKIRATLDAGSPAMLGLVREVSADPRELGHNHQVVAYGYDLDGSDLTLWICDPNWPDDDTVTLRLDVGDPGGEAMPAYSKNDGLVVCFFETPYVARDPVPWHPTAATSSEGHSGRLAQPI